MPTDIFSRAETVIKGVFNADQAAINFGGTVPTALCQSFTGNYAQTITRLYEVGGAPNNPSGEGVTFQNVYLVSGRTAGQAALQRVIGPSPLLGAYYKRFGNVCNVKQNTMKLHLQETDCSEPGLGAGSGSNYDFLFCVITNVGISFEAQGMIINEASQLMFSSLLYSDAAGTAGESASNTGDFGGGGDFGDTGFGLGSVTDASGNVGFGGVGDFAAGAAAGALEGLGGGLGGALGLGGLFSPGGG